MAECYPSLVLGLLIASVLVSIACASIGRTRLVARRRGLAKLCRGLGISGKMADGIAYAASLLVSVLLAGCSRAHPTQPARSDGEAQLASASAVPTPALSAAPASPTPAEAQVLAVAYVTRLRAALIARDRPAFAQLLSYPVRVNTRSLCAALISSPQMFVEHFDEVVTGRVEQAIDSSHPPEAVGDQGLMLDRGGVWISVEEGSAKVQVFNTDVWRFGLPCAGEAEQPLPVSLSGSWQVTSVASLQSQIVPRSPRLWLGKRIELDLANKSARLALDSKPKGDCVIERSAHWGPDSFNALGAPRAGLSPSDGAFIDLTCGSGSNRRIERVDVLGESALAIVGDDGYLLVLKRAPSRAFPMRVLKPNEPCGGTNEVCPSQQICTARGESSYALHEACAPIDRSNGPTQ